MSRGDHYLYGIHKFVNLICYFYQEVILFLFYFIGEDIRVDLIRNLHNCVIPYDDTCC